jgi:hypothetical protein
LGQNAPNLTIAAAIVPSVTICFVRRVMARWELIVSCRAAEIAVAFPDVGKCGRGRGNLFLEIGFWDFQLTPCEPRGPAVGESLIPTWGYLTPL